MSLLIRSVQPRLLVLCGLTALCCCLAFAAGSARAADPAIFKVGAAKVDVTPTTPQYMGGYGDPSEQITDANDPLEVRAFVVAKGSKAVAFVSVDSTGWFSEYSGGLSGLGTVSAREGAAAKLADRGFAGSTRADVIVSSTHTHAAPTLVGIWGITDHDYLKEVHDAAIAAVDAAAADLKDSEIWTSTGSVRSFVWQNGQGTNHPDGFGVDEKLPVLWARDPGTKATNAIYANVPNHPDQFNGNAQDKFSADWPGYARAELDEALGGTSVIAAGTLGRQEPPGSVNDYTEVIKQGEYVTNAIQLALAEAEPLESSALGSAESQMTSPADNAGLLQLIGLDASPPGGDRCSPLLGGNCTIPRQTGLPYQSGTSPNVQIGTYVNSFRIGDLHYTTNPGEAFPEVNDAIRESVTDAQETNVVGMAGDLLGYYYMRADYTANQFGSSNFPTYNVGPDLGSDNVQAAFDNAGALGFNRTVTPSSIQAEFDTSIVDRPGIQFYPTKLRSDDPEVKLYVSAVAPQKTVEKPNNNSNVVANDVVWGFDDGSGEVTSTKGLWTTHTFPGPGTYEVVARATDETNDTTREWTETIIVDPPLKASAETVKRTGSSVELRAQANGGSGKVLSATWTCPDGDTVTSLTVTCGSDKAGSAGLEIVDGSGNTASSTIAIAAPTCTDDPGRPGCEDPVISCEENPKQTKCPDPEVKQAVIKITAIRPKAKTVRRGKAVTVAVTVKNTGNATANKVKLCAKVPKKARKGIKAKPACKASGSLAAGAAKVVRLKLKTTRKARKKTVVAIATTSSDAGRASGRFTLKTKKAKVKKNRKARRN